MKSYKPHTLHSLYNQEEIRPTWFYEYWYDDSEEDYCTCGYCTGYEYYDYVEFSNRHIIHYQHKNRGRYSLRIMDVTPMMIDMMSIYSKEMIRQKKIDHILGDESESLPNTIENILKSTQ
jgi:hypothetical protein